VLNGELTRSFCARRLWVGAAILAMLGCGGDSTTYDTTLSALGPQSEIWLSFDSLPDQPIHLTIAVTLTDEAQAARSLFDRCPRLGSNTQASVDDTLVPVVTDGFGQVTPGGKFVGTSCAAPKFGISLPQDQVPDESTTTLRIWDATASWSFQIDDIYRPRSLALIAPPDGKMAPGTPVKLAWSAPASEPLDDLARLDVEAVFPPDPFDAFRTAAELSMGSTPSTTTFAPTNAGIAFVFPDVLLDAAPGRLTFRQKLKSPPLHDCAGPARCSANVRFEREVPITILPKP
jgi:hypothetical protein